MVQHVRSKLQVTLPQKLVRELCLPNLHKCVKVLDKRSAFEFIGDCVIGRMGMQHLAGVGC